LLRDVTGGYVLHDFDAIVLGRFNGLADSQGTNFGKHMQEHIAKQKGNFSFDSYLPPGIQQVADAFPKNRPIVLTSMFAKYDEGHFKKQVEEVERIVATSREQGQPPGGQRIGMVNSRAYVKALGECGNNDVEGGTCHLAGEPNAAADPSDMHRCVGTRGGHPSLVVWDIIEELHRGLGKEHIMQQQL
jgi:hypothetical protein